MKFIYPAVFRKTDKGTYKGFFPDLEDCFGEGETLDEAIEEANAAAYNWISLELDEIMNCADTIAVIYNGSIQKIAKASELTANEVGEFMMGVKNKEKEA